MPASAARETGAAVREALRRHTGDLHQELHRHASFVALFQGRLSLAGYRALLQRFHGFYLPLDGAIEQVMADAPALRIGYRGAARSRLLAQDLIDLGESAQGLQASEWCRPAAGIVSPRSLGGVLYVVEGSALGGSVIDRAASALLGSAGPSGRHYWSWCRAVQQDRWAMTNRYLDGLVRGGASLDDLAAGARDTFQVLADWLAPLDREETAVAAGLA